MTARGITADDGERGKESDRDRRTVYDSTTHDAQADTATAADQREDGKT